MNVLNVSFPTSRDSGNRKGRQKDYQPTMWNEHFDEKQDVIVDNDRKFRVYFAKRDATNKKPLLVLLHGGGYSALTWAHFSVINEKNQMIELAAVELQLLFYLSFAE